MPGKRIFGFALLAVVLGALGALAWVAFERQRLVEPSWQRKVEYRAASSKAPRWVLPESLVTTLGTGGHLAAQDPAGLRLVFPDGRVTTLDRGNRYLPALAVGAAGTVHRLSYALNEARTGSKAVLERFAPDGTHRTSAPGYQRDETCGTGQVLAHVAARGAEAWHYTVLGLSSPSGKTASASDLVRCDSAHCQTSIGALWATASGAIASTFDGRPDTRWLIWLSPDATPLARRRLGKDDTVLAIDADGVVALSTARGKLELVEPDGSTRLAWTAPGGGIQAATFSQGTLVVLTAEADHRLVAKLSHIVSRLALPEVRRTVYLINAKTGEVDRSRAIDAAFDERVLHAYIARAGKGRLVVAERIGVSTPVRAVKLSAFDLD